MAALDNATLTAGFNALQNTVNGLVTDLATLRDLQNIENENIKANNKALRNQLDDVVVPEAKKVRAIVGVLEPMDETLQKVDERLTKTMSDLDALVNPILAGDVVNVQSGLQRQMADMDNKLVVTARTVDDNADLIAQTRMYIDTAIASVTGTVSGLSAAISSGTRGGGSAPHTGGGGGQREPLVSSKLFMNVNTLTGDE